ncbi:MAG: hypothetical protein H0T84_15245 [Tatlockia sp.]|nr:hypothetical protein [Tatlockia sp.]
MNKTKLASTVLALTAATAFSVAPITATAGVVAKVICAGVNSCKGKSACKTATNACKGQNSCKGKGVVKTTKKRCLKKGGKIG